MKMESWSFALSLSSLDPNSRHRIRIFTMKLLVVLLIAVAIAVPQGHPPFRRLAFFCTWQSLIAGMTALFQRQPAARCRISLRVG
jgi:hypothetical protein